MKKTDKKIDNAVREALTEVCESALDTVPGFRWITHLANYNSFPASLSIICVFNTDADLASAHESEMDNYLRSIIKEELGTANICLNDIGRQVSFHTEEACQRDNDGNWHKRFRRQ